MTSPSNPLLTALEANLAHITLDRTHLAEFCQKHQIRKLSLFGSILREDFNRDRSDIEP